MQRRPGRPKRPKSFQAAPRAGSLEKHVIIERALELAREESLSTISIVRVAESFNVQAGTVHYHVGSREALITGALNRFYRLLGERIDARNSQPRWQEELRRIATIWFDIKTEYPGIAHYMAAEDRFRVFQKPMPGEPDYGAAFMDRVFRLVKTAGFSPVLAAECWHQLALLTTATAREITSHHGPAEAAFLLDRSAALGGEYTGLGFALPALARLDIRTVFQRGLDDLVISFERRLRASTR